jgi:hypothetical protein
VADFQNSILRTGIDVEQSGGLREPKYGSEPPYVRKTSKTRGVLELLGAERGSGKHSSIGHEESNFTELEWADVSRDL